LGSSLGGAVRMSSALALSCQNIQIAAIVRNMDVRYKFLWDIKKP